MICKTGLVHPQTKKLISIIEDLGIFTLTTYPTAYIKVDLRNITPEPQIGQMYNEAMQVFYDEPVEPIIESSPAVSVLKREKIKALYKFAKDKIDEYADWYSGLERKEWDRLVEESIEYMEDNDHIGPILLAKQMVDEVDLDSFTTTIINKSNAYHAWLAQISVWRTTISEIIKDMTTQEEILEYTYEDSFPELE